MRRDMTTGIFYLVVAWAVLNGLMYVQQPAIIFYPIRNLDVTPTAWGLEYEDVNFRAADGVMLHGWYIPRRGASRTVLFFHGNAGNISHRGDSIAIFHRLGLNVFIFDYRGYGRSEGRPGESGLHADGRAAWNYLTGARALPANRIVVFGRSLGGAVAARVAAEVQPGAVILESTFSSARDFAHLAFPLLSRLVVLRYHFNTAQHLEVLRRPLLVLHSPEDEIMPFTLGEKVFAAAHDPKMFVTLRGDHNNGFLLSQPGYEQAIGKFLATHLPPT